MMSLTYYLSGDYARAAEAGRHAERSEGDMWRDRFGLVVPPPVYGASVGSWALAELGDFAEAHQMSSRGLATAEKLNHPHSIAFACMGQGLVYLRQGAATAAVAVLERAANICKAADLPTVFLELAGPLASAYVGAGRAAEAIALLERAVAQAVVLRHRIGHVLRSGNMAEALLAAGRFDEAAPLVKLYVQFARAANTKGPLAWALHLQADVALRSESFDADTVETALGECLVLATELGMRPLQQRLQGDPDVPADTGAHETSPQLRCATLCQRLRNWSRGRQLRDSRRSPPGGQGGASTQNFGYRRQARRSEITVTIQPTRVRDSIRQAPATNVTGLTQTGVNPSGETGEWVTVLGRRTDAHTATPHLQPGVQGGGRPADRRR
jgi:hypothetical protein